MKTYHNEKQAEKHNSAHKKKVSVVFLKQSPPTVRHKLAEAGSSTSGQVLEWTTARERDHEKSTTGFHAHQGDQGLARWFE